MGRKSHKAGRWHHTDTNKKNVQRNRGWRYHWGKYWRKRQKNERRKAKRRARRIIGDLVLFLLFLAVLAGIFWLGIEK